MTTENIERAFAVTRGIVANLTPKQLDAPTPCVSWDVRETLRHVVGGAYYFATVVNTGKFPDPPADDANLVDGDYVARYDEGIKQAVAAFGAPGAQEKMVELPFGTLPVPVFMGIATTDVLVHGWDIARATGQSTDLDPQLASQLLEGARLLIQPAFRGPDGVAPFGEEQPAPAGATAADQLAAFLGRRCTSP
jgi:uncharacterized protein (TIGR03086 family)